MNWTVYLNGVEVGQADRYTVTDAGVLKTFDTRGEVAGFYSPIGWTSVKRTRP